MNSADVDRWIARARRHRVLIVLFLLGLVIGLAIGFNLMTIHQLVQAAGEQAAQALVILVLLTLGVRS